VRKKKDTKSYIAIDPGKGGAIAYYEGKKAVAVKCPKSTEDMAVLFSVILSTYKCSPDCIRLIFESVHALPTDGRTSAFNFGKNVGHWEGIIGCHEIQIERVVPVKWQKHYKIPKITDYYKRKQWLKKKASSIFKDNKVTMALADALLLLNYIKEIDNG
jgi:hypothetical protein